MNQNLLKHYAIALFSLGKEQGKIETYLKDLEELSLVFEKTPEYLKILSSPKVTKKEKETSLDQHFASWLDQDVIAFIKVMIKKKAIYHFSDILKHYRECYNQEHGVLEGRIYTPFPLKKETLKRIEENFEKKYSQKVIFKVLIDKRVIAGMKIYVQDTLYDYSIDTKLNRIRDNLVYEK
jgi:F-type H+-transporting ATPase subunit delta